jgi:hypothetical protein
VGVGVASGVLEVLGRIKTRLLAGAVGGGFGFLSSISSIVIGIFVFSKTVVVTNSSSSLSIVFVRDSRAILGFLPKLKTKIELVLAHLLVNHVSKLVS